MSDEISDLVACPVCFEAMLEAHLLICGHTFCLRCLQGLYDCIERRILCPTCRTVTLSKAQHLQKNFLVCQMAQKLQESQQQQQPQQPQEQQQQPQQAQEQQQQQPAEADAQAEPVQAETVNPNADSSSESDSVSSGSPASSSNSDWSSDSSTDVAGWETTSSSESETNEAEAAAAVPVGRYSFHGLCSPHVRLDAERRVAERVDEVAGVLLSSEPLRPGEMFEVTLEDFVDGLLGSVIVAVTCSAPESLELPETVMRWNLPGIVILCERRILRDQEEISLTSVNLDSLSRGDRVGVCATADGRVQFFVNGRRAGPSVPGVGPTQWAVVDLFGMTTKVSISDEAAAAGAADSPTRQQLSARCGRSVTVTEDGLFAERREDEYNCGVVLSSRPLARDEIFEVRLDQMCGRWIGMLKFGVVRRNPSQLELANCEYGHQLVGAVLVDGCSVKRGKTKVRTDYPDFLEKLKVGDRVGVSVSATGDLRLFFNGLDQGVAATGLRHPQWALIDIYGKAVKIGLVAAPAAAAAAEVTQPQAIQPAPAPDATLRFHSRCGSALQLEANGRALTRRREKFCQAVALTNRPLQAGEMFEVRVDEIVSRWFGSMKIGVSSQSPQELILPDSVTSLTTGFITLSEKTVYKNGEEICLKEQGVQMNLEDLKVGDCIGLTVSADGCLDFFINGVPIGVFVDGVHGPHWGVVDVYGQTAKISIC